jgi:outer membrane biogenesis lipoprotein LolB
MVRFRSAIALFALSALLGCSAQVERPEEQQERQAIEKKEQSPSSIPTFTYRPGAGLLIEGR